jgi:hypothetical protein
LRSQDVAKRLKVVESRITRVESGERRIDDFDLATFLGMCDVASEELDALAALAHEPDGYRVQGRSGRLPDILRTLIFLETTATTLEDFEPLVIPGLAQTEDYACALFNWGNAFVPPM